MGLVLHPRKIHVSNKDMKVKLQLYASITHSEFVAVNLIVLHSAGFLVLTTELKYVKSYLCSALHVKSP